MVFLSCCFRPSVKGSEDDLRYTEGSEEPKCRANFESAKASPSTHSSDSQRLTSVSSPIPKQNCSPCSLLQKLTASCKDQQSTMQALQVGLGWIAEVCGAAFACVSVVTTEGLHTLVASSVVGAPTTFQLCSIKGSNTTIEHLVNSKADSFAWEAPSGLPAPSDACILPAPHSCFKLVAVAVKEKDSIRGVLTAGFTAPGDDDIVGSLHLVSANLVSLLQETYACHHLRVLPKLVTTASVDATAHKLLDHFYSVVGKGQTGQLWFKLALVNSSSTSATIFDDISQVSGAGGVNRERPRARGSQTSALEELGSSDGVLRSVVALRSTLLRFAFKEQQLVLVPNVQKLLNQSSFILLDLFSTCLLLPPVSVVVLPLKADDVIYGGVFCLSSSETDFAEALPRLKEAVSLLSSHMREVLTALPDYQTVQLADHSRICGLNTGDSEAPLMLANTADGSGRSSSSSIGFNPPVARTISSPSLSHGCVVPPAYRPSISGSNQLERLRGTSLTSTLAAGLTYKLNQKRIRRSLDLAWRARLDGLKVKAPLGSGGFAHVFKGVWRGLVVAVKVVLETSQLENEQIHAEDVSDAKDAKNSMKAAHEIALLMSLSHPGILQAYTCVTDVVVEELLECCFASSKQVVASKAVQQLYKAGQKACHVQIVEYCDGGTLMEALQAGRFHGKVDPLHSLANSQQRLTGNSSGFSSSPMGSGPMGSSPMCGSPMASQAATTVSPWLLAVSTSRLAAGAIVQFRKLVLTLLEIAGALAYLHMMGVVHCDLKPANILLKSCSSDERGFNVKVADFGLSRVEDDGSPRFPINSCGTVEYLAPEGLITNNKINSSVDVYAFGIIMWELYTGRRVYEGLSAQQVAQRVVQEGLRPRFPQNTPACYKVLASACWAQASSARPHFEDVLESLNNILKLLDAGELPDIIPLNFERTSFRA